MMTVVEEHKLILVTLETTVLSLPAPIAALTQ